MRVYTVSDGEVVTGIRLASYQSQYVYSGGVASGTEISGGKQYVSSGGSAAGTVIGSGCQYVSEGGRADNTRVKGYYASQLVYSGGTAAGTVVSSAGSQIISWGGAAVNTSIFSGGSQIVRGSMFDGPAGSAVSTTIFGGRQIMGGVAIGTTISGGIQSVGAGGSAVDTVVCDGGRQTVDEGGTALNTIYVGSQVVSSGEVRSGISMSGLVNLVVSSGGKSADIVVRAGGLHIICGGGSAINTKIGASAEQMVFSGGVAFNTALGVTGVQNVSSGGFAGGTTVSGFQNVLAGGSASAALIECGKQNVRGTAENTILSNTYGDQHVFSGGLAINTTILSGYQRVSSGGVAVNTTVSGGWQMVSSGGAASDTRLYRNGGQEVYRNGLSFSGFAVSGGFQYVYVGTAYKFTVSQGGKQLLYNYSTANAPGRTVSTFVLSGGKQIVSSGGLASATILSSGGKQYVSSGGGARGGMAAGSQIIYKGGSANGTVILSGGKQLVQSGGRSVSAVVASGGTVCVYRGGKATALTVQAGGSARLSGGALMGVTNVSGAFLSVVAGGVKIAEITADSSTRLNYDLRSVSAGGETMLAEAAQQNLSCTFTVTTAAAQQIGTYKLSSKLNVADGTSFSIRLGTTSLGAAKLNGAALSRYGVTYQVTDDSAGSVSLALSLKAGSIFKGTDSADTLTGTSNSDIFYGGMRNDTITAKHGRDVAVYDTVNWGQDVIKAKNGTLTLLFAGLSVSDITQTASGSDLVLTRKGTSQKITVQGWNDATHNIVFTDTLTKFTQYLNAATPTAAQTTAARNEVWAKAGLAASTSNA